MHRINFFFILSFLSFICAKVSFANHEIYKNDFEKIDSCEIVVPEIGHSYFVSVNGRSNGTGSLENPLDLATALSSQSPAQDGDTIWVLAGTYTGLYTSNIEGRQGSPITVRPLNGNHVVIDTNVPGQSGAGLTINGDWVIFRDFEVMSSDGNRETLIDGSNPSDITLNSGVTIFAESSKLINFVIHDTAQGISFWKPAINSELYGNIIYNNGWSAPGRGHGHAIYTQNLIETKLIENNIIFFGFGTGIHAYTENGSIQGFDIKNNVWFQTGASDPRASQRKDNCLVGGFQPVARLLLENNQGWSHGRGTRIGYGGSVANVDVTFKDNYLAEGVWIVSSWQSITMVNNTIHGSLINLDPSLYPGNTITTSHPDSGKKVFLEKNKYDLNRARLTIYNYDDSDNVSVDASSFLTVGDSYEIFSVFDIYGDALLAGIYDGNSVSIPMGTVPPVQPIGLSDGISGSDDPGKSFAVFLIRRTACAQ